MDKKLKVAEFVKSVTLRAGLGHAEFVGLDQKRTCTIGAINLALTGRLRDDPLPCMSLSLTDFVIELQDRMSDTTRNSAEWRAIIPLLLDTKDQENEIKEHIRAFKGTYAKKWCCSVTPIDVLNPPAVIRQILGLEPLTPNMEKVLLQHRAYCKYLCQPWS